MRISDWSSDVCSSDLPDVEWPFHAPYVEAINRLKRERNAVVLAHNYQTPEIFHCVSDFVGDSLALARQAAKADADRSEERRVGKECGSTCRSRWSPDP